MSKLFGSWVAGGNSQAGRKENDFYKTPAQVIYSLLLAEGKEVPQNIWEPACGEGDISKVLLQNGFEVESTDLIDRGYGKAPIDFLTIRKPPYYAIITNPPFDIAENFILHAHSIGIRYMALLLKATYWHAVCRAVLYERFPPSRIYAFMHLCINMATRFSRRWKSNYGLYLVCLGW